MTIMYLCALNIKEIANPKEYYWPLLVVYQLNFTEQTITDHEYREEAPCLLLITVYKISPTDDCNLLQFHSNNNNYFNNMQQSASCATYTSPPVICHSVVQPKVVGG